MSLPTPGTGPGQAGLAAILAAPRSALIALDYDGTLAPIVSDPALAEPAEGAIAALVALAGKVGTLAIVTGRPVADVMGFLHLDDVPELAELVIAGHYGLERLVEGRLEAPQPFPGVAAARERLATLLADAPDARLEDKGHALAVHTRRAPDPAGLLAALTPALRSLAAEVGLAAEPGRYVLELRPPGMDKGAALRRLRTDDGAAAVLFAGDDLGDLAAYAAVEALRADGIPGVTVCSRSAEESALLERADLVLDGPAAVVDLLAELSAAID